jgi:trimethylamine--corrinoid protein Co-methyltransferase
MIYTARWNSMSEGDLARLHTGALTVLRQTGVAVMDDELRGMLQRAGARVEDERVYLPPELVEQALAQAPRDFRLYDRHGGSFTLARGSCRLACTGDGLNVLDYATNTVRQPTLEDVGAFARLADALPSISVLRGIPMVPAEPEGLEGQLRATEALLLNSTKHYFTSPLGVPIADAWIDLAEIINQGVSLAERPIFSALITPTSPLQLGDEDAAKLKRLARKQVPILATSAPMAGATSPYTLAGTLTLQNAENLFLITAIQVIQPGAPVMLGPVSAILDMPTGSLTYASPEYLLFHLASLDLASHYGLPGYHPMAHTDASELDYQAGIERGMSLLLLYSAGAPVIGGAGSYHKTNIVSPEQLLVDVELYEMVQHLFKGFPLDDDSQSLDEIERVGPGGNFLVEERTMRYFRSGMHFLPKVFNRNMRPRAKPILDRAHQQLEAMANTQPDIPAGVADEVRRYVQERAPALGLY